MSLFRSGFCPFLRRDEELRVDLEAAVGSQRLFARLLLFQSYRGAVI